MGLGGGEAGVGVDYWVCGCYFFELFVGCGVIVAWSAAKVKFKDKIWGYSPSMNAEGNDGYYH